MPPPAAPVPLAPGARAGSPGPGLLVGGAAGPAGPRGRPGGPVVAVAGADWGCGAGRGDLGAPRRCSATDWSIGSTKTLRTAASPAGPRPGSANERMADRTATSSWPRPASALAIASTRGSPNPAGRRPSRPPPAGWARRSGWARSGGRRGADRGCGGGGRSEGWSGWRLGAGWARSRSVWRRSQNCSGAVSGSRSRASSTPCSSYRWRNSASGLSMTSWSASENMAAPCFRTCVRV